MLKTIVRSAIFCLIFTFTACTKTVKLDLRVAPPVYVIEGDITDQTGPYLVRVFQTTGFYDSTRFKGIEGAVVRVSDGESFQETLTDKGGGNYYTLQLQGKPGDTYTLNVTIGNYAYTAISTMPQPVSLNGLHTEKPFNGSKQVTVVVPDFTNPPGPYIAYYYFDQTINGYLDKTFYGWDSRFSRGEANTFNLERNSSDSTLHSGDTVTVTMQCIDSTMYTYWSGLVQSATGDGSAYPGNPVTNIVGGALGYFSAHTSQTKGLRVP